MKFSLAVVYYAFDQSLNRVLSVSVLGDEMRD